MVRKLTDRIAFVLILISAFLLMNCGGEDSDGSIAQALLEGRSAIDSKNYVAAINIFNEKMRCYVSLAKCLLEYNVCTDIMMSTSSDIEELKKQSNREEKDNQELKNLKQIYRDYQKKRIEPFAKIRQELSNAEVFFRSETFLEIKNKFNNIFKQIRNGEIKWGPEVFNQLIDDGKELQISMGNELKKEF